MSTSADSVDPRMNARNHLLDWNMGARIGQGLVNFSFDRRIEFRPFRWKRREQVFD